MKRAYCVLVLSFVFSSCPEGTGELASPTLAVPGHETPYQWKQLTAAADFPKSYNFQLFATDDTVWAFHPEGNWYSSDGATWTRSGLPNSIRNPAFLDYVQFNNAVYGLGRFDGNIEKFTLSTAVTRTTDFRQWELLAANSELPKRFFYHPFVFKNKIWIIGGSDGLGQFSDVWNSADGIHWTRVADGFAFGKRDQSQVVFFKGMLYLLNNDVWSSMDGIRWIQVTDGIVPGENIFGYAAIVYDNKIWLLGCNRNGRFKSEILVSEDGKKWKALAAPWTPRGGVAACVFKNKLIMTGGKYGGPGINGQTEFIYSNDVWSLEKRKG